MCSSDLGRARGLARDDPPALLASRSPWIRPALLTPTGNDLAERQRRPARTRIRPRAAFSLRGYASLSSPVTFERSAPAERQRRRGRRSVRAPRLGRGREAIRRRRRRRRRSAHTGGPLRRAPAELTPSSRTGDAPRVFLSSRCLSRRLWRGVSVAFGVASPVSRASSSCCLSVSSCCLSRRLLRGVSAGLARAMPRAPRRFSMRGAGRFFCCLSVSVALPSPAYQCCLSRRLRCTAYQWSRFSMRGAGGDQTPRTRLFSLSPPSPFVLRISGAHGRCPARPAAQGAIRRRGRRRRSRRSRRPCPPCCRRI